MVRKNAPKQSKLTFLKQRRLPIQCTSFGGWSGGGSKTGVSQDAHKKRASEKKQTWGQKQVWHKWSQERCILCGPEGNVSMARRLASHCFSGRSQSQHFSPSKKLLFSIAFPSPVRYASVPTNTPGVPQICLHSNDHLEWSQGHFTCVLYITTHKQLANWQIHKPRACMHTYIPFVQVNTSQQNKVILLVCCTLQHTSNNGVMPWWESPQHFSDLVAELGTRVSLQQGIHVVSPIHDPPSGPVAGLSRGRKRGQRLASFHLRQALC